jgi:AraC-like DNA-binding protein
LSTRRASLTPRPQAWRARIWKTWWRTSSLIARRPPSAAVWARRGFAARHQVTPRYIQKLFESEGTTLTDHVLEQRLARAYRLLSNPRHAAEKISAIAFDCGFGDLSYFYRSFRRHYGATPSDVRAQSLILH